MEMYEHCLNCHYYLLSICYLYDMHAYVEICFKIVNNILVCTCLPVSYKSWTCRLVSRLVDHIKPASIQLTNTSMNHNHLFGNAGFLNPSMSLSPSPQLNLDLGIFDHQTYMASQKASSSHQVLDGIQHFSSQSGGSSSQVFCIWDIRTII